MEWLLKSNFRHYARIHLLLYVRSQSYNYHLSLLHFSSSFVSLFQTPKQLMTTSISNGSSSEGINSRVVEGQTHDSLKLSPDAHSSSDRLISEEANQSEESSVLPPAGGSLKIGEVFRFRLTVLQASHVPADYADIFCQFKYVL